MDNISNLYAVLEELENCLKILDKINSELNKAIENNEIDKVKKLRDKYSVLSNKIEKLKEESDNLRHE